MGVLGNINAYVDAVEAQGRGTLHLHALLWLRASPTASEMQTMLKDTLFCMRVVEWIKQNIHADIGGLRLSQFMQLPHDSSVSSCWPLDPQHPDRQAHEHLLAHNLQIHVCSTNTCLKKRNGRWMCKRGFPFICSSEAWVDEDGQCGPARLSDQVNAWNPSILELVGCNNDMKLTLNSTETAPATWYLSAYTSKKQRGTSNASAIFAQ